MPQLEQIDTFVSQIFWLAITFGALYFFLRRVVLPGIGEVLENRGERIRGDLDRAGQVKIEAERVRDAYEAAIAEGRADAQMVIRDANAANVAAAAKQHEVAAARLAKDIAAAEKRIAGAREGALKNIRAVAADAAREVAGRLVGLKVDSKTADKAVASAVKERA